MPLSNWADKIRTSIRGRRLGLDDFGFVVGTPGQRHPYESLTSASTMANSGLTVLSGSTATFTLQAPPAIGVEKTIVNGSSVSTAQMTVVRSTAAGPCSFFFSTGTERDGVRTDLINSGAAIDLVAVSTSRWGLKSSKGSSLYNTVSTSS